MPPNFNQQIHVLIDSGNQTRIEQAIQARGPAHLHFNRTDFEGTSDGHHNINISSAQYTRLVQALRSGSTDIVLKVPFKQLEQQGGSLFSFIAPLLTMAKTLLPKVLPAIGLAAATGAIQGATNSGTRAAIEQQDGGNIMEKLQHGFNFSKNQKDKIIKAIKERAPVRLRVIKEAIQGSDIVPLLRSEFDKVKTAIQSGSGLVIKLDGASMADSMNNNEVDEQEGGFLQFLIPFLAPILGSMVAKNTLEGGSLSDNIKKSVIS